MKITEKQNQKTIEGLYDGLNSSWELFIYGDKKSGVKPGNVQVYGSIVGQREVIARREDLQQVLEAQEKED